MKKILLIEDEPDMRRNLVTILKMEGFEVAAAADGEAGVALAKANPPHLILCDIMMPKLDGYAVLETLREAPATVTIPFIFLTAKGEKTDMRAGMNLGADDYLTKPVAKSDLLTAIATRLARHEQQVRTEFNPDFSSPEPLKSLGLTPREAEVLLWVSQGKSNGDVSGILGMSEGTVKKHLEHIFEKLGVESRNAALIQALEVLSSTRG